MIEDLVSIITPCYNGAKYIQYTIDSVLSQTYTKWEMIIVDDGSTDNSSEVIAKYTTSDQRIKYIKQENGGSASARNNGIRNAVGQYICLLDADDLWNNDFLEKQIAFIKEKDATCVCCAYRCINEDGSDRQAVVKVKKVITVKDMLVMNRIGCLTGVYNTKKHGKVYLREELKSMRDDYAFWLDVVKLDGKAYGNQEVLASYRVLANSTTGNKKKLIKKQYRFYRDYLKLGVIKSLINICKWGFLGLKKYKK